MFIIDWRLERYYDEEGKITKDISYQDGEVSSIFEYYYDENGKVERVIQYDGMGQKQLERYYDEEGKETKNVSYQYQDGEVSSVSEYTYHANGKQKTCKCWENGILVLEIHYYENGNQEKEISYNKAGEITSEKYYNEDGSLKE